MPRRPSIVARNGRCASSIVVVVALGLFSAGGCSFPVEDFSEPPGDAPSVDGPPLGDPRPDAAQISDATTATGSTGGDDHSGSDHGKKKGHGR